MGEHGVSEHGSERHRSGVGALGKGGTPRSRRVLLLLFVLGLVACGGNGSPSAGTKSPSGSATTTTALRSAPAPRPASTPMTDEQTGRRLVITSCGTNASNNLEVKGTVTTTGSNKVIFSAVINANDPSGKLLYPVNLRIADDVPGTPVSFTSTVQIALCRGHDVHGRTAFVSPAAEAHKSTHGDNRPAEPASGCNPAQGHRHRLL